ncbi:MAG TPA: PIG-L family deacetylase [Acidimicrobiales bacterium]
MDFNLDDIDRVGTVLTVWAHPDDETFLAGGLIAAVAASGQRIACVTATSGERGTPDPVRNPPHLLAATRRQELTAALETLGVEEHLLLDAPDGGCACLHENAPIDRLVRYLELVEPDTVVTFGPDGVTGHSDHIAVSRWVDLALEAADIPTPRLLHVTQTAERVIEFADVDEALGVYMDREQAPVVTPREQLAAELVLTPALLERKMAALRAHWSQTESMFDLLGAEGVASWLGVECFVDGNDR